MFHLLKSVNFSYHPKHLKPSASSLSNLVHLTSDFKSFFLCPSFPTCLASKKPAVLLGTEWVSDGHLFHFYVAKLKRRNSIPLPAIANWEWLSGLGLVQGLLMVLSVSVKSLRPRVPQETSRSKVWLGLSTWWMNRGQLGCHGWNHCDITNTVHVLRGHIWRCHAVLPWWMLG